MKCLKADDSDFVFSYGEKGEQVKGQASILLLHGFTADHFMFAPIVQVIFFCFVFIKCAVEEMKA